MTGELKADAWVATALGDPTKVLERQQVEVRPPGPNEVRVQVSTFCVNFNDTDIVRGRWSIVPLQPPFTPGMEAMGVVESAGPGAEHLVGRRIVGIPAGAHGGFAEWAVVDATSAMLIPDWMDDVDGAALHYPFHLSWFALFERARLQPGETVLVHAGAGGVGSAAIQLAKHRGAKVIATAGSPEKLDLCRELGADEVVNYRDGGFAQAVMDATYQTGVDVALDSVGGAVTTETFGSMGMNGRHLIVGYASDITNDGQPLPVQPAIYGNFSLCGVCLAYAPDPLATRLSTGLNWPSRSEGLESHRRIIELLRTGEVRTVVTSTVGFDDLPEAMERQERRETMGRTVVRLH
ncbi:zinc-binding dehydrogenase [Rhabdothermincola salaria]|uniref:zinc-binding dehydrogenase n=1 Tax=Rhabdothermincola salaria TaxID=2903142 RepID=UPI001E3F323C|nr:zinc-binding dehydrogenase [Rhabdothermincola salaria]MCD9622842.1 zinc-binding dehydrogenase [Rhabdothermincola salaria]